MALRKASTGGSRTELTQRINKIVDCPICGVWCDSPVVNTSCGHVFCDSCINDAIEKGMVPIGSTKKRKKKFQCPVCSMPAFKWTLRPLPILEAFIRQLSSEMDAIGAAEKATRETKKIDDNKSRGTVEMKKANKIEAKQLPSQPKAKPSSSIPESSTTKTDKKDGTEHMAGVAAAPARSLFPTPSIANNSSPGKVPATTAAVAAHTNNGEKKDTELAVRNENVPTVSLLQKTTNDMSTGEFVDEEDEVSSGVLLGPVVVAAQQPSSEVSAHQTKRGCVNHNNVHLRPLEDSGDELHKKRLKGDDERPGAQKELTESNVGTCIQIDSTTADTVHKHHQQQQQPQAAVPPVNSTDNNMILWSRTSFFSSDRLGGGVSLFQPTEDLAVTAGMGGRGAGSGGGQPCIRIGSSILQTGTRSDSDLVNGFGGRDELASAVGATSALGGTASVAIANKFAETQVELSTGDEQLFAPPAIFHHNQHQQLQVGTTPQRPPPTDLQGASNVSARSRSHFTTPGSATDCYNVRIAVDESLSQNDLEAVQAAVQELGGLVVPTTSARLRPTRGPGGYEWGLPPSTHCVCKLDAQTMQARPSAVLAGCLVTGGVWVIDVAWVQESRKQRRWILEDPYECRGTSLKPRAMSAARTMSELAGKWMRGHLFYLSGSSPDTIAVQSRLLLTIAAAGGIVLNLEAIHETHAATNATPTLFILSSSSTSPATAPSSVQHQSTVSNATNDKAQEEALNLLLKCRPDLHKQRHLLMIAERTVPWLMHLLLQMKTSVPGIQRLSV